MGVLENVLTESLIALTHCGLLTSCRIVEINHHWHRWWIVVYSAPDYDLNIVGIILAISSAVNLLTALRFVMRKDPRIHTLLTWGLPYVYDEW